MDGGDRLRAGPSGRNGGGGATPLVRTAQNAKLQTKVLINRSGRTLYRLSVEHKGHLICTERRASRYGIR